MNTPGGGAQTAKIVTNVKALGGTNVVTMAKPGIAGATAAGVPAGAQVVTAAGASPGQKQTIVINKATWSNFREWANKNPGNICSVWNKGEAPVELLHKCSVKDLVLAAADEPR